jgi:2-alkenal reductase
MRAPLLAVVAIVSAVVGGAGALAIGHAAGWVDDGTTATVTAATPAPEAPPPATVKAPAPLPPGFDPARIYAERSPGVVTIHATFAGGERSQGSGFVVSADGVILTSAHVITNAGDVASPDQARAAPELAVQFNDRDRVAARVVGWDVFDDVGVVRVDPAAHVLTPLPLGDSEAVAVGWPVAAIGSPFGQTGSLSVGVVSATRGVPVLTSSYQLADAIQTDTPINRGNSGGPLFDARGRVIGINAQIRSDSGTAEGVGFAVPINAAKRSLQQLVRNGKVSYAYVGISTDDLTPELARRLGVSVRRGALVTKVPDGPAREAGLRAGNEVVEVNGRQVQVGGDVVTAIDDHPVRSGDDLVRIVAGDLLPGQVVTFSVVRGARRLSLAVRLAERPAVPPEQ